MLDSQRLYLLGLSIDNALRPTSSADVVATIKAGFYDIGIGAGVESMSVTPLAFEGSVISISGLHMQQWLLELTRVLRLGGI
jgi:hypothetical protein